MWKGAPVNAILEEDALAEAALLGGLPVADAQVKWVLQRLHHTQAIRQILHLDKIYIFYFFSFFL